MTANVTVVRPTVPDITEELRNTSIASLYRRHIQCVSQLPAIGELDTPHSNAGQASRNEVSGGKVSLQAGIARWLRVDPAVVVSTEVVYECKGPNQRPGSYLIRAPGKPN